MASDDWEFHRNTISCLFLLEKLPLKDVSARMKEEHNFDRKKYQYEYQLKKWGIKKNLRRDVWRYVSHEVRKRKRVGKTSEVTLFGMQLPPDKLRKEVQRYTAIPTAKDFGRDVPSPTNPGWDIVRVVTPSPPDFQCKWPETLPWLRFIEGFQIDFLQVPNMAELLMTAGTASFFHTVSKNTLALYTKIDDLARSIPQNREEDDQNVRASLWTGGPSAIAIESLKVILFSLANKTHRVLGFSPSEEDEVILSLLGCIWESNFKWSSRLLGTTCPTTNAISEAVYGCAVRQQRYALISQLLEAGVDPNIPVHIPDGMGSFFDIGFSLKRGKIRLGRFYSGPLIWNSNTLEIAVELHDIRLGTILLDAGANMDACKLSLLERIETRMEDNNALEFIQLLTGGDVESELLSALGIAIAKRRNRLVKFWIGKVHQMTGSKRLISYSFGTCHGNRNGAYWYDERFQLLQIDCTLLHIAIISENTTMADFLLRETLACTGLISMKALRDLFMVACLAGDRSTIEQLVVLNVDWGGDWTQVSAPSLRRRGIQIFGLLK
ncbi:hypothetical protein F4824DRAFT_229909 [Ustulina deusta]|nr:hypothetical protein F4824DRAFT_229909 [Ustulina deusta]